MAARLAEAQTVLAADNAPPGNLPPPLTPLIGRAQELAMLIQYLHHAVYRCVTLFGPGGMGKTRLARALGAQVQPQFPDGVWLVELNELAPTTPDETAEQGQERLAMAIGQTLNFAFYGTQPPTKQVAHYLANKTTLLILDSFEHLTTGAGAPWLTGWSMSVAITPTAPLPTRRGRNRYSGGGAVAPLPARCRTVSG